MRKKDASPGCTLLFMVPFALAGVLTAALAGLAVHTSWRIVHDYEVADCKVTGYDYSVSRSHGHVTGYYGAVKLELDLEGHAYGDTETVGEGRIWSTRTAETPRTRFASAATARSSACSASSSANRRPYSPDATLSGVRIRREASPPRASRRTS